MGIGKAIILHYLSYDFSNVINGKIVAHYVYIGIYDVNALKMILFDDTI